jgi:uncharacterized protein (DUF305 family)
MCGGMTMRVSMLATALLGTVGGALLLAGCTSGQAQGVNDADVTFAEQMIGHHEQAIMMADLAEERAQSPQVKQLATQIRAEQEPEIQTMSGWLRAWGKPVPELTTGMAPSGMPHMPTMMPSMTPQPGASDMTQIDGTEFDQMFLQMMIAHHEDAVAMAKTEQVTGANADAKQLAANIQTSQTAQIAQMQQMLQSPSAHHS